MVTGCLTPSVATGWIHLHHLVSESWYMLLLLSVDAMGFAFINNSVTCALVPVVFPGQVGTLCSFYSLGNAHHLQLEASRLSYFTKFCNCADI